MTHTHEAMLEAAESRQDRNVGDLRSMLRQCLGNLERVEGERDRYATAVAVLDAMHPLTPEIDKRNHTEKVMQEKREADLRAQFATAEAEATRLGKLGLSQYHGELQDLNAKLATAERERDAHEKAWQALDIVCDQRMERAQESEAREREAQKEIDENMREINKLRQMLVDERRLVARVREALTPSPKTKYAYMGEFPVCGDDGIKGFVPWVTMKQIMAAILALATPTEPETGEGSGDE